MGTVDTCAKRGAAEAVAIVEALAKCPAAQFYDGVILLEISVALFKRIRKFDNA